MTTIHDIHGDKALLRDGVATLAKAKKLRLLEISEQKARLIISRDVWEEFERLVYNDNVMGGWKSRGRFDHNGRISNEAVVNGMIHPTAVVMSGSHITGNVEAMAIVENRVSVDGNVGSYAHIKSDASIKGSVAANAKVGRNAQVYCDVREGQRIGTHGRVGDIPIRSTKNSAREQLHQTY